MDKSNEEEEEDLYSDLPNFKYDEAIDKIQSSNKELQSHVAHLEEVIEKQTKELEEYRSLCTTLTNNISSLLKTAQNEVKRKDQKIKELNKTVLELKTEILTSRKRKYNNFSNGIKHNEEPTFKRQRLQDYTSAEPDYSYDLKLDEKIPHEEKLPDPDKLETAALPKKQVAPDIKCHTVYSQRMYNKIYNIGNKSAAILPSSDHSVDVYQVNNVTVEIESNNVLEEKRHETCKNLESEDRSLLKPIAPNSWELPSSDNQHEAIIDVHDKNTKPSSDRNQSNNETLNDSKPVCNVLEDKEFISFNKKSHHNESTLISRTSSTEINQEDVDTVNKIISLVRDKSFNNSPPTNIFKTSNCIEEKKRVVISSTNRSVNFSKTDNFSKSLHVKHCTKNSSAIINEIKVPVTEKLEIPDKINLRSDRNHKECNEKQNTVETSSPNESVKNLFSKSHCLRKTKKTVKNVICPISGPWVQMTKPLSLDKEVNFFEEMTQNSKTENENTDIMEALFGSPLKWTENSVDDAKQVAKLIPPDTAFEDSCSAHIENVKFKKVENNVSDVNLKTNTSELSLKKKFSYTERKCYFQPHASEADNVLSSYHNKDRSDVTFSKEVLKHSSSVNWPFRKSSNEIPSKNRAVTSPTFSSFVNTETTSEACDVPSSLKSNPSTVDVHVPIKFIRSPKYNDSVLGQFDDTTQLINALAKDPSKLSPIHTPKKETKLDSVSIKTPSVNVEKSVISPLVSSVEENLLAPVVLPTSIEKKIPDPMSLISSDDKNISILTPKISSNKSKTPNSSVAKNVSVHPPLISSQKKISVSAATISSVEKRLLVPSTVQKKVEKKTILLEQPINILCPRKTPRQIGRYKQNDTSKKQNMSVSNKANQTGQKEHNEIKSPSPQMERSSKTDSYSNSEVATVVIKNKADENFKKKANAAIAHVKSSLEEENRSSKSPSNVSCGSTREAAGTSNKVTTNRIFGKSKIMTSRHPLRKDHSPAKEKSHHSSSRKENIPRKKTRSSPSRKENSPVRSKRDMRPVSRDAKYDGFKRPIPRKESFKKPHFHIRQTSVDRKFGKDWRHLSRPRSIPSRTVKAPEISRTQNGRAYRSNSDNKFDSKDKSIAAHRKTVISRSSRISWSASTGVVSTKTSNTHTTSDFTSTPPPQIKWVLTPIDFIKSTPKAPGDTNIKMLMDGIEKTPMSSKHEVVTPVSKNSPLKEPSSISPDRNSPAKPMNIVIVPERRPIKFGSNN